MPSIDEIAKLANVSKMTVSNVINKKYSKVSESTRKRIEQIIEETGYTPNLFARSLKSRKTKIVMLVIPQTIENDPYKNKAFNNPFYGEIINSIEYNLRKKGYYLMFRFIQESELLKNLIVNWSIDGVIIIGAVEKEMNTIFNDVDIPSVFLDSYINDNNRNLILIDDIKGGFVATEHLIKCGYNRIGFVTSMLNEVGVASKRFEGYKKALSQYGLDYNYERVFQGYVSIEYGMEVGRKIKQNLHNFDALFVYSDIMALSVIRGLNAVNIRIPEDIAIVGFDDLFIGNLSHPTLTSIKQDVTKKGEVAVEILDKSINGKLDKAIKEVLPIELIIRNST